MAASRDLVRIVGDRQLAIRGVFLKRVNGVVAPIDLTGATVEFRMVADPAPHTVVVNWEAAQIEDAVTGHVYYPPSAAAVATAGLYRAWFRSTVGGLVLTAPADGFLVELRPTL